MDNDDVMIIDLASRKWPRWMIYSILRDRYWNKGRWRKKRRNGEVWNVKSEAVKELQAAKLFGNAKGSEDE